MQNNIKTTNLPQTNLKGIIIVLIVIGLISIFGLIAFIITMKINGENSKLNNKIQEQEKNSKKISENANSERQIAAKNMKRGDQGPPGIQGPPGPTGGVHAGVGPLLCVGQRKVATPTVGTSPYSIIYLDNRRYTPIQYWTMKNNPDGTVSVVNKFTGNCMTTSTNTADVYSDRCINPVPMNQKFNWLPNMQLSSAAQQNQCLSVQNNFAMTNSNSNNRFDLDNLTEKRDSNNGSVTQLKLMQCSASQNLDQTWWIGN